VEDRVYSGELRRQLELVRHLPDPFYNQIWANVPWGQLLFDVKPLCTSEG
jgi:hypothetical protein